MLRKWASHLGRPGQKSNRCRDSSHTSIATSLVAQTAAKHHCWRYRISIPEANTVNLWTYNVSTNENRKLNRIPAISAFGLMAATAVAIVVSSDGIYEFACSNRLGNGKRTYNTMAK